jgi:plasmid stabilization system protein ParE
MKQYKWDLSLLASKDIEEAVNYYNENAYGLGNKFLSDVEVLILKISRNPLAFSVKYDDIHCAALNKFPFSIHYTVNKKETQVIIVSVFNTWKEPFW